MRAAGYTAVGEFHYLGAAEALAAADAAADAGIAIVLLHVAYERGGLDRMRQPSVRRLSRRGRVAPRGGNRGRRCPPLRPRLLARLARGDRRATPTGEELPLHIHADEQPREIQECLEEHGCRPIELLADTGCLSAADDDHPRDARERRRARSARRRPGRASAPARRPSPISATASCASRRCASASIPLCIGSDSNMRIDPLEELRELEGIARRQTGRRGILTTGGAARDRLGRGGSRPAARGLGARSRSTRVIARSPGVAPEHVEAALIAGCTARRRRHPGSVIDDGRDRGDVRERRDRAVGGRARASSTSGPSGVARVMPSRPCSRLPSRRGRGAVALVKVDVDANQGLSQRFSVSGIPAVKAFRDGRVVAEFAGARSRAAVDTFLDELLAPPRADALIEELRAVGRAAERRRRARRRRYRRLRCSSSSAPSRLPTGRSASGCARSRWRCSSGSTPTIRSSARTAAGSRPLSTSDGAPAAVAQRPTFSR